MAGLVPVPSNGEDDLWAAFPVSLRTRTEPTVTEPATRELPQMAEDRPLELELTRFRGHLTVKTEGVRNAHHQAAVSGGVPTTDHRARPGREVIRRARA